ncbi:MAG: HD domain-containing protein [Patescibacteria group bacterium]
MSLDRDLEFLYEIGTLRYIPRMWQRFLRIEGDNLAEHHLRVAWTALFLAKHEKAENTDKILKMALLHDIAESRTGDVDYLSRQYVIRNEDLGFEDMIEHTALAGELQALHEEYEQRQSIESKIVKDADNLAVDFEMREQADRGIAIMSHPDWQKQRAAMRQDHLFTETAKKVSAAIRDSNPHDWHLNGRNRYNAGDWKKPKKT